MQSVINDKNKVSGFGTTMKFKKIGDKIEGTLVDKRMATAKKYMSTEMEDKMVYEIKVPKGQTIISDGVSTAAEEDEKYIVWGKAEGKSLIDSQMTNAKLGQIIALVFEGTKENTTANPTHIIQLYQDKKMVDAEWLEMNDIKDSFNEPVAPSTPVSGTQSPETPPTPPTPPTAPVEAPSSPEAALKEIIDLAKVKYSLDDEDAAKNKVMEETKLAFLESNYPQILEFLKK